MENDTENTVEPDVTGFGNPSLDSDPIDETTSATIDSLLDEALGETETKTEEVVSEPEITLEEPAASVTEPAVEPEPTPVETIQTEVKPQVEIDPEIAAIEQPRNLSEKNQSNWRKLQETASQYKQQAAEAEVLRQRLSEAEQRKEIPQGNRLNITLC